MAATGRTYSDLLGIVCSVGCAIHCAATPVLLAVLPTMTSVRWLANPLFHQIVAVVCGVLAMAAFLPGYLRHRAWKVPALAMVGMAWLLTAAFVLPDRCCQVALPEVEELHATASHLKGPIRLVSVRHEESADEGLVVASSSASSQCDCSHEHAWEHPHAGSGWVSVAELQAWIGQAAAQKVIASQPWMSPLGGLFLVVAHVLNLRGTRRHGSPCGCGV
jgi:hypothetical protein